MWQLFFSTCLIFSGRIRHSTVYTIYGRFSHILPANITPLKASNHTKHFTWHEFGLIWWILLTRGICLTHGSISRDIKNILHTLQASKTFSLEFNYYTNNILFLNRVKSILVPLVWPNSQTGPPVWELFWQVPVVSKNVFYCPCHPTLLGFVKIPYRCEG